MKACRKGRLFFALFFFVGPLLWAQDAPLRVYVFTQQKTDGFVDGDSQRRIDSVADLRKQLAKRRGFALVEAPADADVRLEVTLSGEVEVDPVAVTERHRGILGPELQTRTVRETKPTLICAVRIPGSDYTVNFSEQGGFWGDLAKRVADQFQKWTTANRARLHAR